MEAGGMDYGGWRQGLWRLEAWIMEAGGMDYGGWRHGLWKLLTTSGRHQGCSSTAYTVNLEDFGIHPRCPVSQLSPASPVSPAIRCH